MDGLDLIVILRHANAIALIMAFVIMALVFALKDILERNANLSNVLTCATIMVFVRKTESVLASLGTKGTVVMN